MGHTLDPSTLDTGSVRLKLAEELVFTPQVHGETTYYHIEHPTQGRFYRVGYPEYVFLSTLDGSRTVAQALAITARILGANALSNARGKEIATWLVANRLASLADQESGWLSHTQTLERHSANGLTRFNPFWIKLPLGSPDRLLSALLPGFGWMFSVWGTLAGLTVIAVGVVCLFAHWPTFTSSATTVLAPHNWLWLMLASIGLKAIHEFSHGLACKYYGCEVRQTGIVFILLAPMAYLDVTSCWRIPSRWRRIHVAAAGMFAELVVAAIAAVIWTQTESSIAHHLLFNVIVMASLTTILFNANPLVRFDGYFILADLLKIPNLATEGSRFVASVAQRICFGTANRPLHVLGLQRALIGAYGFASAAWKILICISLVTAAAVLLQGAGLLLACWGVIAWVGQPLWELSVNLQRRWYEDRISFYRATMIGGLTTVVLAAILWRAPVPGRITAPAVVDYTNTSVVRCSAAGFVQQVHVVDGQSVEQGDLLVELSNDEMLTEQRELELAYEQELVRYRVALNDQNGAAAQVAQRNLEAISDRRHEVTQQVASLQVCAPLSGRIVGRNLEQTVGTHVAEGDELLMVADESRKELIISIAQDHIDTILPQVGAHARFRVGSRLARYGTLDHINPRASNLLPHPALNSAFGGPLAVKLGGGASDTDVRLAEPRFSGSIHLPAAVCQDLGAGERGYVVFGWRSERLGEFAWLRFHKWWESILSLPKPDLPRLRR
ncbi:MAG: efflux RND transporter periplasmic adaptor subunit [Planctomycetales bacterium]|nr:efflux RND transporter periplasmic adaptor subunit [Planctomycetales bacterium]